MQRDLPEPAKVNRFSENPLGLLWRVKAHRVLRHDEVDHELGASLIVARFGQWLGLRLFLVRLDVADQIHQGIERRIGQPKESVLNLFRARLEFSL